jgi:DNA-binding MarR family transcriptional regulator
MAASGRKPAKALPPSSGPDRDAIAQIDAVCRRVVAGKLAMRELADLVRELGVSDSEFRLLWQLEHGARSAVDERKSRPTSSPDQSMLAEQLALSPAQLSGMVERLSAHQLIEPESLPRDRRRQAWRISLAGQQLITSALARVKGLQSTAATAQEAA